MRKLGFFGIAMVVMLAGIAVWAGSSHSAVKAAIGSSQIDPLSLMATAKKFAQSRVAQFEDVAR